MMRLIKTGLVVGMFVSLTGCGSTLFSNPATNPVIEDKVGQWGKEPVGTLAVTADRRVVIVKLDKEAKFCAEPPPDVAENLTKELAVALKAQVAGQGDGEVTLSDKLMTQIQSLINRTQGADLYRTGMYDLCQNYVNGAISGQDVKKLSQELLETSKELILVELESPKAPGAAISAQPKSDTSE